FSADGHGGLVNGKMERVRNYHLAAKKAKSDAAIKANEVRWKARQRVKSTPTGLRPDSDRTPKTSHSDIDGVDVSGFCLPEKERRAAQPHHHHFSESTHATNDAAVPPAAGASQTQDSQCQ